MELESSNRYGSWSGAAIEKFLSDTRIPLRLSFLSQNGMIIVPVWFEYQAGRLWSCSPNDSLLVRSLRENPEVAFDISTNDLPYQGVRGRGLATCTTVSDRETLERLLVRYVAGADNDLGRWLLDRDRIEALIEIEFSWLTSWDFSARMDNIEKLSERLPGAAL